MRRFFRFSIRELFLVTLIVAMALGWCIDRQRLAGEVIRINNTAVEWQENAQQWRGTAGALEEALKDDGWRVTQRLGTLRLEADKPLGSQRVLIRRRSYLIEAYVARE